MWKPTLPKLPRPSGWTRKTWDRLGLAAMLLLGALAVWVWLPAEEVGNRLDVTQWNKIVWIGLAVLIMIFVGLATLHGTLAVQRHDQDSCWDEVERLRGELAAHGENTHQLALLVAEVATARVRHDPVVDPPTGPITVPGTVIGIPSARPMVPRAEDGRRGKHAAAN